MLTNYLHMLKSEFKNYNAGKFKKDFLAGLTVAAVALPLALAFGVASGADAAAGLVTAIVAGFLIGGLSGGFYQISGPTGAMSAILMGIVATQGLAGVMLATFLAGAMLLLAGLFKLGSLTSFIPAPVITGFTSGISIIIALGQVDNFFGVKSVGATAIEKLGSYGELGFHPQLVTVLMGLLVIIGMIVYPKKWQQKVPSSLVAIILATAVTMLFHLDVATVGAIPSSLIGETRLTFANINLAAVKSVITPAVSIALLGMIESLLCGASAGRMTGVDLDSNQELVAQGVGNMFLPFIGGIPATAAIARTSVAIKSGAVTRVAGLIHALCLLLSMFFFAGVMSQIPMAALAGVLMVTAFRMNEWHTIKDLFAKKYYTALALFFITMICTVVFDLSIAIVVGIVSAAVFFLIKSARIQISSEEIDWERMNLEHQPTLDKWSVIYISGPLFFMSMNRLKAQLDDLSDKKGLIFSLRGVANIDTTALDTLRDYLAVANVNGQEVIFTSIQPEVEKNLLLSWKKLAFSAPKCYSTVAHALAELHQGEKKDSDLVSLPEA